MTLLDFDRGQLDELRARHRTVLQHNVRGFMVTPSDELYGADGNTWGYLWDTMFAVTAVAADDALLAGYLLRNYLTSQHPNGMVPHMAMWSSGCAAGLAGDQCALARSPRIRAATSTGGLFGRARSPSRRCWPSPPPRSSMRCPTMPAVTSSAAR